MLAGMWLSGARMACGCRSGDVLIAHACMHVKLELGWTVLAVSVGEQSSKDTAR